MGGRKREESKREEVKREGETELWGERERVRGRGREKGK